MKRIAIFFVMSLMVTACATDGDGGPDQPRLAYACSDAVVLGGLTSTRSGPTENIEGDILGHGWFSAELNVRKRLAGTRIADQVQVRYFGHAQLREDRDFVFVVGLVDGGKDYIIRRASLVSSRPQLESQCGS